MCCNISCKNSNFILFLFSHLFVIKSDLIFQFFHTFRWHIEYLTIKHSIDALPNWEIQVSYYNHQHRKILIFQFISMLMFHQKLLSFQRQCQQENVFLQSDQQFNSINKLRFYLKGFHPFFIDSFENCLGIFFSRKIVNDLTFVHNANKFF